VALTAPYLHDGSAATIEAAIARHAIALTPADTAAIRRFLDDLTDRTVTTDVRFGLPPKSCSSRN